MQAALEGDGTFACIDRQVDLEVAAELEELALPGIGFLEVPKRYYPAGALAPQVLGFVNVDGVGAAGLESAYDDILAGTPGERTAELSADGLAISSGIDTIVEPVAGSTMHTTIDRQMQYMVQAALERAVQDNDALGGTAVVMDPCDRRGARDGNLSVVRPERLRRGAARGDAQPRRHRRLRAGLRQQDHHRGGGARDRSRLARPSGSGCPPRWRSVPSRSTTRTCTRSSR